MSQTSERVQIDEARKILSSLIKRGITQFKPTLNKDGVHYVEIEKDLRNADPIHIAGMLKDLSEQGILEAEPIDRVLTCPDCSLPEVYSKYVCPKCGSYNVEYTELIEHGKCGHIGSKDKFVKGSALICPGCQARLEEEESKYRVDSGHEKHVEVTAYWDVKYLVIGSCYQCEKCGYRFDKPEVVHFCQKCGRTFTYQEAKYIKIYAFKMSDQTESDIRKDLPIAEKIREILTKKGFKVQLHPQIKGSSGVQHSFDILAEKDGARLVIDISMTGNKNDMISLLGKKIDTNLSNASIIDLSNLDELSSLGKVYDIAVFKNADDRNLSDFLRHSLATMNI